MARAGGESFTLRFGASPEVKCARKAPMPFDLDTICQTHTRLSLRDLTFARFCQYTGSYLPLRTCSFLMRGLGEEALQPLRVTDEHGTHSRLQLLDHISPHVPDSVHVMKWILDEGVNIVIIDPIMRMVLAEDGLELQILCANQSCLLELPPTHQLYKELEHGKVNRRPLPSQSDMTDVRESIRDGDMNNVDGEFAKAWNYYADAVKQLLAMRKDSPEPPSPADTCLLADIFRKRSMALAGLGYKRRACQDLDKCLELQSSCSQARVLKARILVDLLNFREAKATLSHSSIDKDQPDVREILEKVNSRLSAQRPGGRVPLADMLEASANGTQRLFFPDFQGSLCLSDGGDGRGIFKASRYVQAGEVILVQKSVLAYSPELMTPASHMKSESAVLQLVEELGWRASEISLCSMEMNTEMRELGKVLAHVDEEEQAPPDAVADDRQGSAIAVDYNHLQHIVVRYIQNPIVPINARKVLLAWREQCRRGISFANSTFSFRPVHGVWPHRESFRQSCEPNCHSFLIGDMLVVSATQDVKKGQDLTLPTTDSLGLSPDPPESLDYINCGCGSNRCGRQYRQLEHGFSQLKRSMQLSLPVRQSDTRLLERLTQLESSVEAVTCSHRLLFQIRMAKQNILARMRDQKEALQCAESGIKALGTAASFLLDDEVPWHCFMLASIFKTAGYNRKCSKYRRLGLEIARRMFGSSDALVQYMYGDFIPEEPPRLEWLRRYLTASWTWAKQAWTDHVAAPLIQYQRRTALPGEHARWERLVTASRMRNQPRTVQPDERSHWQQSWERELADHLTVPRMRNQGHTGLPDERFHRQQSWEQEFATDANAARHQNVHQQYPGRQPGSRMRNEGSKKRRTRNHRKSAAQILGGAQRAATVHEADWYQAVFVEPIISVEPITVKPLIRQDQPEPMPRAAAHVNPPVDRMNIFEFVVIFLFLCGILLLAAINGGWSYAGRHR